MTISSSDELRAEVQALLQALGEPIDIPDAGSPGWLPFMRRLQQLDPTLAARLAAAVRRAATPDDRRAPDRAARARAARRGLWRRLLFREETGPDGQRRFVLDKRRAPAFGAMLVVGALGAYTLVWSLPNQRGQGLLGTPGPETADARRQVALEAATPPVAPTRPTRPGAHPATPSTSQTPAPHHAASSHDTSARAARVVPTPVHRTPPPTLEVAPPPVAFTAPIDEPSPTPTPVVQPPQLVAAAPVRLRVVQPDDVRTSSWAGQPDAAEPTLSSDAATQAPPAPPVTTPASRSTTPAASVWSDPGQAAFGADPDSTARSSDDGAFAGRSALVYARATTPADATDGPGGDPTTTAATFSTSSSGVVYQQAAEAHTATEGASEPFGGVPAPETPPSAPFQATQQVPATLVTGIEAVAGSAFPVVAHSAQGEWIGQASINATLSRVDIAFSKFVQDGRVMDVNALAYDPGLTQGLSASMRDVAPALASDLVRSGLAGLNSYAQSLAGSGTTLVQGGTALVQGNAVPLGTALLGELGKVFKTPENQPSFVRVAKVERGTSLIVMVGVK